MIKIIGQIVLMSVLFISTACAEEAGSPVDPVDKGTTTGQSEEDSIELSSLVYKGLNSADGRECHLYISIKEGEEESGEHDHDHEGEHSHEVVAKVEPSPQSNGLAHGLTLADTIVDFYKYKLQVGQKYFPEDSTEPGAKPVLASVLLKDEEEADVNKIDEYDQTGKLLQSLRIEFSDMDIEAFEEALEEVIEDKTKLAEHQSILDQVGKLTGKIDHGDHADPYTCEAFQLESVKTVEFKLDADHDDHDHDHDH